MSFFNRFKKRNLWKVRESASAKEAAAWIEATNPLRGMTVQRAVNLFDAARLGDTTELQWLYNELERVDPTLLVCSDRRAGAVATLDWQVKVRTEKRTRGFDKTLAEEQEDLLNKAFGRVDTANLNEAVEHLAQAFFRGFAHVSPMYSADGLEIKEFELLNNWNFARDIVTGGWFWNPRAYAYDQLAGSDLSPIPTSELCTVTRSKHIDYPAMTIYLRNAVGEKGWGQFVERYGVPPVIITMPDNIPADKVAEWSASAEDVAMGASGALPGGSQVFYADGARGVDPFSEFLKHQQELVVLMATGGKLTSLSDATGIGSGASEAHEETWREVWTRDSLVISGALNRSPATQILNRAFPGKPHLAYFDFDKEASPTAGEIFDDAGKARAAGYLVEKAQLEEKSGYKLTLDTSASAQSAWQGQHSAIPTAAIQNKATEPVANPLQNSSKPSDASTEGKDAKTPQNASDAILAALAKDLGEAGKAVADLLAITDPAELKAAAADLIKRLPELLPSDPEMVAIIEEAIADTFATTATKEPTA